MSEYDDRLDYVAHPERKPEQEPIMGWVGTLVLATMLVVVVVLLVTVRW